VDNHPRQIQMSGAQIVAFCVLGNQESPSGFLGKNVLVLYMVIERYVSGPGPVYERAAACGRMLPEGLVYVSSWVVADAGMDRCFQLMETSDPALFDVWFERWNDLVSFEVYPLITSAEAAARGTR
jgi:hypothetical protein